MSLEQKAHLQENCCICGRDLPNRYAVAGRCEGAGCSNPFCALHWRRSDRRCREHGYQEADPDKSKQPGDGPMSSSDNNARSKSVDPARLKKAVLDTFTLVKKMGVGAVDLLKKLKKDKSPQAMLKTIEESQAANQARREAVSARVESLFNRIAGKKKAFEAAPPARKRILEAELRSRLAEYKASERELTALLENETVLSQTKGRLHEVMAYGMAGVSEEQIDTVIDEIEEGVAAAEGRLDVVRDLEKAGRRRERESDREGFMEELAEFDAEQAPPASSLESALAGFEETPAKEKTGPEEG